MTMPSTGQILLTALAGFASVFLRCASSDSSVYDRERITLIESWELVYSYSYGEPEPTDSPWDRSPDPARPVQTSDLRLPDNIFQRLKKKSPVPVSMGAGSAEGRIRLHAHLFASGGCKSLDVALLDRNNEVLAHTRLLNRNQGMSFGYDDNFVEYAANEIARLLELRSP